MTHPISTDDVLDGAGGVYAIFRTSGDQTPAPRPLALRRDHSLSKAAFGRDRVDWRQGLGAVLEDLKEKPV